MAPSTPKNLLVIGVGGLGKCLVEEALTRNQNISVLIRNRDKLTAQLGEENISKLTNITVGDATDPHALDKALHGIDVVISGRGADPAVATALSDAVSRNHTRKICWPAGTTNVLADDGKTPNYLKLLPTWPVAEQVYKTHQECIDALSRSEATCVFWCPGKMDATGHRSPDVESTIRINRDAGAFVSYEDAAWVILEAALTTKYDNKKVSAATPQ
jgi:putative NADH-flavin reductase